MKWRLPTAGFTMVEVIVVVSIIGILVSLVTININEARATARDNTRVAGLEQLQVALEIYKAQYGVYPDAGCGAGDDWAGPGPQDFSSNVISCDDYIVGDSPGRNFVPDFIAELPSDPKEEDERGLGFIYRTNSDNSAYKAVVYQSVELETVDGYAHPFAVCPTNTAGTMCNSSPDPTSYGIYSAGAEDWEVEITVMTM